MKMKTKRRQLKHKSYPDECLRCGHLMTEITCVCGTNYSRKKKERRIKPRSVDLPSVADAYPTWLSRDKR